MIEIVENTIQLAVLLVCAGIALGWSIRDRAGTAMLLFLFLVSYALGDLYWLLYLIFYGHTPRIFYVSELSWYAAFLFMYMLVQKRAGPEARAFRHPALWLLPVFCVGMAVFYMHWGDYPGNVICAVLMSLLLYHTVRGLVILRTHREKDANRPLYIAALVFCILEYGSWTASCFWTGDTWTNSYFLFDCLMTAYIPFLLASYRKAVAE